VLCRTLLVLVSFVTLGVTLAVNSAEAHAKLLMGVLGDSISAATFADVPLSPAPLGVAGFLSNKESLSWGSGRSIKSHFLLLRKYLRNQKDFRQLEVLNLSQAGNLAQGLVTQARHLVRAFKIGGYESLPYVVLTVGSNDACDLEQSADPDLALAEIRESILLAARVISTGISQREPMRILVLGAPQIPDLGRPEIRKHPTLFGLDCETFRNRVLGLCSSLTLWADRSGFLAALKRVAAVNQAIAHAVSAAEEEFPHLRMVFSERLFSEEIRLESLAADCFHPSGRGQEEISLKTWQDQPWFRLEELEIRHVTPPSDHNPGTDDPAEWIA
jgi:hypothetical protein